MKSILILFLAITVGSCKFFKKTPEEAYKEKMETATDEELMNEIIGKPLMYELSTYEYASIKTKSDGTTLLAISRDLSKTHYSFAQTGGLRAAPSQSEGDALGYEKFGLRTGAVLNVIFTKGSVYIEKFGRLNGSYERGNYANSSGDLKLKFGEKYEVPYYLRPKTLGLDIEVLSDIDKIRNNPVRKCELLSVKHTFTSGDTGEKVIVKYYLKSLTRPGYFHKETLSE
ncbi:MAG: hypothetical protein EOO85_16280 [Pedobacter sp.]|nr:MAG: hypothetical protein EOO85_16280 [Pedobacter sp.]